ncbi:MAG: LegC family aminotransferase [Gammaproteobacteria bacterium]|nr:LegC family aminotransferase [Gammaproteobacteria bacterium]MDH5801327.1 LegC family aminotransferase [Gammaproteobacteria bacterium]
MNIQSFVSTLKSFARDKDVLNLHEPIFLGKEKDYVNDCIETGWVSSVGAYVNRFEKELAEYTGSRRAIAVVNGTAALHISLLLNNIGENDEVLLPALTFVASANAIAYCRAIPHFVEISQETLGVDPELLRRYLQDTTFIKNQHCINRKTGRPIKALMVVHAFGHCASMEALHQICQDHNLALIEDAAEALGSTYKNQHAGTFGQAGALSFNGNKIITTGGGGAVLLNSERMAEQARHISTTAKLPHGWEYNHDQVGYNYRMPNINAALGVAQLEQLPQFLLQKRRLTQIYKERFLEFSNVTVFEQPQNCHSNYWLNVLLLDQSLNTEAKDPSLLDQILAACHDANIMVRPAWRLLHQLPMYTHCPKMDLSFSEDIVKRLICLPSSADLVNHAT